MIDRKSLVITLLVATIATAYNVRQFRSLSVTSEVSSPGSRPAVEAAPALQVQPPQKSSIATAELWNLKATTPLQLPPLKELFKPYYTLNKNGRFETVQRSDRPNERWEFQGVIDRGTTKRALFYNPGLKKLRNLGKGDIVDERLVISSIDTASVTLEVVGEKKPQQFKLRIFNTSRESYATKRKIQ
jgi:hypothetical protein